MFYSFVTLTQLEYGDVVPVTGPARSPSILEAICGIMYVAILVARLVGLYASTNPRFQSKWKDPKLSVARLVTHGDARG